MKINFSLWFLCCGKSDRGAAVIQPFTTNISAVDKSNTSSWFTKFIWPGSYSTNKANYCGLFWKKILDFELQCLSCFSFLYFLAYYFKERNAKSGRVVVSIWLTQTTLTGQIINDTGNTEFVPYYKIVTFHFYAILCGLTSLLRRFWSSASGGGGGCGQQIPTRVNASPCFQAACNFPFQKNKKTKQKKTAFDLK